MFLYLITYDLVGYDNETYNHIKERIHAKVEQISSGKWCRHLTTTY